MKIVTLATGFAVGYVIGSRAGREKYEQIVQATRRATNHPAAVQAREKVKTLLNAGGVGYASRPADTDEEPGPAVLVAGHQPAAKPATTG